MAAEKRYFVSGMHCRSCELVIEDKISEATGMGVAKASSEKGEVVISHKGEAPSMKALNKLFFDEGYVFSEKPLMNGKRRAAIMKGALVAIVIAGLFFALGRLGFGDLASVNSDSSFISFLVLGLIAGVSACAALVGGLVLSLSDGWENKNARSLSEKARPHLAFNSGRLVSYAVLGATLGLVGEKLRLSTTAAAVIVIFASIVMVVTGLKMLGVRIPSLPFGKNFSRATFEKAEKARKYAPFVSGFLTFFLPCGFTIAAQSAALASGSALRGGLMMFFFALGTAPSLFAIGLSKSGLSGNKRRGAMFSAAAGFLLLFFAAFNINNQLNVLGVKSLNDIGGVPVESSGSVVKPTSGKQLIKMDAYSSGYKPNYFSVKAGVPVRWEITDRGTSGCTNAVIARGLIKGQVSLSRGKTSVIEFTPEKPGIYKFSCWMGMIQGVIEVK
jgi:sulfite exporter TauE/SafE/plastocyanin/copper chaperone CopZ